MTKSQIKEIRTHLLKGLNAAVGADGIEVFAVENCPDDTDFASQLTQQGLNVAVQRRRLTRISEMEAALRRLSESDYGICEECGNPIGVPRLKANPSARLCVVCQSAEEDGLIQCA